MEGEDGEDGGEGKEEKGGAVNDGEATRRSAVDVRQRKLERVIALQSEKETASDRFGHLLGVQRLMKGLRARAAASGGTAFRSGDTPHTSKGGASTGMIDASRPRRQPPTESETAWRQWRTSIRVLKIPVSLPADLDLKVQATRRFGSSVVVLTGALADVEIARGRFEMGSWAGNVVLKDE